MKAICVVLLLTVAVSAVRLNLAIANAKDDPPAKPIRGLNSGIGRGFDIVDERIRAPIQLWSYSMQNIWYNPYLQDQAELYPDQLYLTDFPSCKCRLFANPTDYAYRRREQPPQRVLILG